VRCRTLAFLSSLTGRKPPDTQVQITPLLSASAHGRPVFVRHSSDNRQNGLTWVNRWSAAEVFSPAIYAVAWSRPQAQPVSVEQAD
jgi:hypothetical protein